MTCKDGAGDALLDLLRPFLVVALVVVAVPVVLTPAGVAVAALGERVRMTRLARDDQEIALVDEKGVRRGERDEADAVELGGCACRRDGSGRQYIRRHSK